MRSSRRAKAATSRPSAELCEDGDTLPRTDLRRRRLRPGTAVAVPRAGGGDQEHHQPPEGVETAGRAAFILVTCRPDPTATGHMAS